MWISADNNISIAKSLDNREQVDAIVLDFSKAFDRVPHQRLLLKLKHYSLDGLTTYTKRSQRVVVDGQSSELASVTSGVLQGTVLAFINYLPASLKSKERLFADDCMIYRSISSTTDAEAPQADLNSLHQWSSKWQMKFNVDKCHTMRITLRRYIIDTKYHLGESTLSMVTEYHYLGLTLTNNLSWQCHIKGIINSANRMLGLIRRNLRSSSRKLRQQAYFTLVRPHLEYCCKVWNPFTTKDIMRVENIQRRAARFVLNN